MKNSQQTLDYIYEKLRAIKCCDFRYQKEITKIFNLLIETCSNNNIDVVILNDTITNKECLAFVFYPADDTLKETKTILHQLNLDDLLSQYQKAEIFFFKEISLIYQRLKNNIQLKKYLDKL